MPVEVVVNGKPVGQHGDRGRRHASTTWRSTCRSRSRAGWRLRISPVLAHQPGVRRWSAASRSGPRKKSAEWCLKAVDQCWSQKEQAIRAAEREEAKKAYDVAREAYRKIQEERDRELIGRVV